MKIVTEGRESRFIVCNEEPSDGSGKPCKGRWFAILLSPAGTRVLECQRCGFLHEVEQMDDKHVAREG